MKKIKVPKEVIKNYELLLDLSLNGTGNIQTVSTSSSFKTPTLEVFAELKIMVTKKNKKGKK